MIKWSSNISEVIGGYLEKLESLQPGGKEYGSMLREVATTLRAEIVRRIHSEGENAQGAQIGQYSEAYKEYRRKKGRPIDKVNLSLTGQLANQFSVVETSTGFGLGWADTEKQQRAKHLEEKYGQVWALTPEENRLMQQIAEKKIQEIFN